MLGEKVKIISLNCQGLGIEKKRREIMHNLKNKNYSIICLVDTHFAKGQERRITSEWGYKTFYSSYNSQSRGVAIFFNNNFEFEIHSFYNDTNGNLLILDVEVDKHRITLATVYGPNKDDPSFFESLQRKLKEFRNNDIIINGDWNLLLNPQKDGLNYKHVNNPNARNKVLKMITELNLYDVWRDENLEKRIYTWKRKLSPGVYQMGRLDFFLVSESLLHFTREENIVPGFRSDHSATSLSLIFNKVQKCKTFWKFNNSLLRNPEYIREIKSTILHVKCQYAATPYNLENINKIENETFHPNINPQLFFEMILLAIRSKTIAFSSARKRQEVDRVQQLESEIAHLDRSDPIGNFETIKEKQEELNCIREKRLEGTMIRAKARWIEHGEKPSSYFCSLENRNFISKRMVSLISDNGTEIKDFHDINKEVGLFYKQLYESKENYLTAIELEGILSDDTPKLNEDEANLLEGPITLEEAANVLSKMKNNKSPGSSGFTVEFFKFFWTDLKFFWLNSINAGFDKGELSVTQKEGVIVCIPKGDKCKKYIKNWRPISLLNVSYKIASGVIASRIKNVLPSIINVDQSGFMTNRFTGDNLRLIYDTLHFGLEQNKAGLLLLIDFEKAFDSVAWSFIRKSLLYFNFKDGIIQWIETFYKNIKSTVIVNNSPTPWFSIERGCRQGDPISPYIFLICSEVLACMIRQNPNIKGYEIFNTETKITQFADDTTLFLDGSKDSFEYCIRTVLEYAKFSGLAMNFDKTKVMWFGCEHRIDTVYLPDLNFEWNPKTFTVLGIEFTVDLKNITDINIENRMNAITYELNQWSKRDLTPFGKVTVIKTLALSKIVHILTSLPSPSISMQKKLNKLFFDFLWKGKPDQIKRSVATLKLNKGGLGMIDLNLFDRALKLTWIRRYITNTSASWKLLVDKKYPLIVNIANFGDTYEENITRTIKNPFWLNVVKYYYLFHKKCTHQSKQEVEATRFLYNSNIQIGKNIIKNRKLISSGIFAIYQLLKNDTFLTLRELNIKLNTPLNFLEYNTIVNSIKTYLKRYSHLLPFKDVQHDPALNKILMKEKGTSHIYQEMITITQEITGHKRWSITNELTRQEWEVSFNLLKKTTFDTKLRWLQFRILHFILTTNQSVSKYKIDQDSKCSFCDAHSETILHLFWNCSQVQAFWNELADIINKRCKHSHNFQFSSKLVVFGISEKTASDKICDLIILLGKLFIYRSKVKHQVLSLNIFIAELYKRYIIEKEISENSTTFRNNWTPYVNLFKGILKNYS